jgi:Fic family protein
MATDLLSEIRDEIDERLEQLRPAVAEYERLLDAAGALELDGVAAARSRLERAAAARPRTARKRTARKKPAVDTVVREAILGVLEHGSHTIAELVVVTAMSTTKLNGDLRKLAAEGVVVKTEREGKTAWSLVGAA